MTTYDEICEKLGFKLENYRVECSNKEDDSKESPFNALTLAELDYVIDFMMSIK